MALHPPPHGVAQPAPQRQAQHRASRAGRPSHIPVALVAALGAGVLLYPSAASWFSARANDAEVTGYVQDSQRLPLPEKEAELLRAHEYNALLPGVPLGDPYATGADMDPTATGVPEYLDELDVTSVMARIRVPAIDVDLPIYHGTGAQTLTRGVGHLFGSSLPVGGAGTHAVLTGHSGLVRATFFDALHDLVVGDRFTVVVLDEVLTYRVDQILTVKPGDTDALQTVPGKDYVTLVTCTPIGVNSHRLLVRGERVQTPDAGQVGVTVPGAGSTAGFPWWALGAVPIVGGIAVAMRGRRPSRHRRGTPRSGAARNADRSRTPGPRHARHR